MSARNPVSDGPKPIGLGLLWDNAPVPAVVKPWQAAQRFGILRSEASAAATGPRTVSICSVSASIADNVLAVGGMHGDQKDHNRDERRRAGAAAPARIQV
jgi:hypothetical protein